jgi:trimethylamine:corrinoid methyltransferase-like protein
MLKGFTRKHKPLEFLTPEEEESIHGGALYVLEKTGMCIQNEGALKQLEESGCRVDSPQISF